MQNLTQLGFTTIPNDAFIYALSNDIKKLDVVVTELEKKKAVLREDVYDKAMMEIKAIRDRAKEYYHHLGNITLSVHQTITLPTETFMEIAHPDMKARKILNLVLAMESCE